MVLLEEIIEFEGNFNQIFEENGAGLRKMK